MNGKFIRTIFFSLLLQFAAHAAIAQCAIGDVVAVPGDCVNGQFYVTLDFNFGGVGSEGFKVQGNGNLYGIFSYDDLPVTIGPLAGNGSTAYEFVVKDVLLPDCQGFTVIDPVDCGGNDCEIWDVVAVPGDCVNGQFFVTLDFNFASVGGEGFKVQGNGNQYGNFSYDNLPVTIGPLAGNGSTAYEFIVKDLLMPDCQGFTAIGPVDCGGGDCDIFDFVAEAGDCNSDGTFPLWLDFGFENVQNDFFDVYFQGSIIGTFPLADLPVVIPNFEGNGNAVQEIKVCINDTPGCCAADAFEAPDCDGSNDCLIFGLVAEVSDCNDEGEFFVTLDFAHEATGNDGFKVLGNGNVYGFFSYDDLPVTIGPLQTGNDALEFIVKDLQYPDCHDFVEVQAPDCDGAGGDCQIFDLVAEAHPCLPNGTFFVTLDFQHENTNGYFKVQGNGAVYGIFSYDDLPVSIGPLVGNGTTNYGFLVRDLFDDTCVEDVGVGTVSCSGSGDCEISNLIADPSLDCFPDDTYNLWLYFDFENSTNNFYDVFLNGNFVDYLPLSAIPTVLQHLTPNSEPVQTVTVCINDNPNCCASTSYPTPICEGPVWPGDVDADNWSSHFDLLQIGLAFGAEGPDRTTQGIEWIGHQADNWLGEFSNGFNFKHADCDGNGKVGESDLAAISLNFGQVNGDPLPQVFLSGHESDPPLFVDLQAAGALYPGAAFTAPILLGTAALPVDDLYGIAFSIHFDPEIVDPASLELKYDPSWLGVVDVNLLTFDRTLADQGIIRVALARTDHNHVSGFGQIAAIIGIIDNIAGKETMQIEIRDVKAIQENGTLVALHKPLQTVELGTSGVAERSFLPLEVVPNPASTRLYFNLPNGIEATSVTMTDVAGKVVASPSIGHNQLDINALRPGIYLVKVQANGQLFLSRVVKIGS